MPGQKVLVCDSVCWPGLAAAVADTDSEVVTVAAADADRDADAPRLMVLVRVPDTVPDGVVDVVGFGVAPAAAGDADGVPPAVRDGDAVCVAVALAVSVPVIVAEEDDDCVCEAVDDSDGMNIGGQFQYFPYVA